MAAWPVMGTAGSSFIDMALGSPTRWMSGDAVSKVVRGAFSNALLPTVVTEAGTAMDSILVQLAKAPSQILVTPSWTIARLSTVLLVLPWKKVQVFARE